MEGAFLRTGMDTLNKKNQASSKGPQIFFSRMAPGSKNVKKKKKASVKIL